MRNVTFTMRLKRDSHLAELLDQPKFVTVKIHAKMDLSSLTPRVDVERISYNGTDLDRGEMLDVIDELTPQRITYQAIEVYHSRRQGLRSQEIELDVETPEEDVA